MDWKGSLPPACGSIHPHIARLYAIERHENVSFLVMEYLEGTSLRVKLQAQGCIEAAEAVRYVGMVCEALAYAHAAKVLHRDVKPENIFLVNGHNPKLLDFGVARILARTMDRPSTRIGTIEYMAPETAARRGRRQCRSVGTGHHALRNPDRPPALHRGGGRRGPEGAFGPLRRSSAARERVDNRVVRVLRKMLSKDPETRYQTAEELARDLETAARRARLADDDESRLEILIRASYPLVCVYSFEEDRVIAAVRAIAGAALGGSRASAGRSMFGALRGACATKPEHWPLPTRWKTPRRR